jgi:malate dehydrogenase (oxaloacetate-decarboxylating)(NADP+)
MLLASGYVEAALVGGSGDWWQHLKYALPIIPKRDDVSRVYAMSSLILDNGTLFFCDTHVNVDPTAEQIAECAQLAAEAVRRFGLTPKAALLSHSSFGASNSPTARKMREALAILREQAPELEVDGEMHADAALSQHLRDRLVADSPLKGSANLLVMPTLDAANIGLTLLSAATESLLVGPLLLGMAKPLHVLIPSVTARGIVNLTALAVSQAISERARGTSAPLR